MTASTASLRLISGTRAPVRCATTENLDLVQIGGRWYLAGLKTIDGVDLAAGDRVLVKDQDVQSWNGIYTASAGPWRRAGDASDPKTLDRGMLVPVQEGEINANTYWRCESILPRIGIDEVGFSKYLSANTFDDVEAAMLAAGQSAAAALVSEGNAKSSEDAAVLARSAAQNAQEAAEEAAGQAEGEALIATNAAELAVSSASAAISAKELAESARDEAAGYAASINPSTFATAAQGDKADTAVQPGDLGALAAGNDAGDVPYDDTSTALGATVQEAIDVLGGRLVSSALTVTVGSGGDFASINAALDALSRKYPIYKLNGIKVEISLLAGFVMAEQVLVKGLDLSWVTITSVDAEVVITRSALTQQIDTQPRYPAFGVTDGGCLPIIDALFNMDASGTAAGRDGVYASVGSRAIIAENPSAPNGVKNAGGDGVSAQRNSHIVAHQTNFSGAGENGCHAGRTSSIDASLSNFSDAGQAGVLCWRNSDVNCYSTTNCSGAGTYGVYCNNGGRVQGAFNCQNATIHGIYALNGAQLATVNPTNCSGAGTDGVRAQAGSIVSAPSLTATGCGNAGIYALYGATISAQNATLTGNVTYGVRALASNIDVIGANCQKGESPAISDIAVAQGGIIRAANATGGINQTANSVTQAGTIYQ